MPFKSEKQRRLMFAAQKNPTVRNRFQIKKKAADEMTEHDTGGVLPERVQPQTKHLKKRAKRFA